MQDVLTAAFEMHQAGRFASAAQMYRTVLVREQDNADALHLLGVLHHQEGNHLRAAELIGRAVALQPSVPAFHANLAEAYRALGQLDRAIGCCRAALRLCPDHPEALCNLGLALQGLGRPGDAVAPLRRVLELRPDFAIAHNNLGLVLRELGQPDQALAHFRRAVELSPTSAPARTNLGQMLLDRGQAEEALSHCQEAVRLQPDHATLHHNLGNAFRALDRFVEARGAYLEALRLDPELAPAHAHLGLLLKREGQLGDALPWLKHAVELDPENATYWEYLAELHDEWEDHAQAIPCWERVLALSPESASAHIALGWALQEEARLAEAGENYRTAVRLRPSSAVAELHLGGLHEELGELAEAEARFRSAVRAQPTYALPHARLATLLRGKLPDADRVALEERLADRELAPGFRARLLFGLAHVLDARGEFTRAADCLRQANALARELARGRRAYVPADHERFVDGLVTAFGPSLFARTAGAGLETPRPVFIFGLPRSGTTLVEQVLASHPRVHGAGELRLARQTFDALPAVLGRAEGPLDCVAHLDAAGVRRLAERHLTALQALDDAGAAPSPPAPLPRGERGADRAPLPSGERGRGEGAERIVDKMPDNYQYLGLLAVLFPRAVFIHCRRDLRDVAVSCWMTDFRSIRWANDPAHIATRFWQYRRLMEHWRAVLPVAIHEVEYEETVADLEGVARRLLAACGQEWDPACLNFHQTRRPVRTASVAQVRQPVYQRSVARWKHYERELSDLFASLPSEEGHARGNRTNS
jgi:tetratricopeptide (TPR) repeat protein